MIRKAFAALAAASLAFACVAAPATAQTYPSNSPVYIPTPVLASQSLSAAGTVVFNANNVGDTLIRFAGSETGLAATVQCTESRAASPTWTNVGLFPVGLTGAASAPVAPAVGVTTNGLYRINSAGCAQVRINVTATTGAVNISAAGSLAQYQHFQSNEDFGAVITNTAQAAGTVTSGDLTNFAGRGVYCVFNQASHTGTPSSTFSIQFKDSASGAYITVLTSAAITADTTPTTLLVYPGAPATANVSGNSPVTRTWRVSETVAGTTPGVTGTVGCHVLN